MVAPIPTLTNRPATLNSQRRFKDFNDIMQQFLKQTIDSGRTDGYWVEAFPFCTSGNTDAPDIIGYGLGTKDSASKIQLFFNPYNRIDKRQGETIS